MRYARECLNWDEKAQMVTEILYWAVRRGAKPDLQPSKTLHPRRANRRMADPLPADALPKLGQAE